MGGVGSSQHADKQLLSALYNHYKKKYGSKIVGGNDIIVGGYSALAEYGESVYSKAKEDLIRGLAKDVSGILGIKNADSGSIDEVIKQFKASLPKPGTGKGTLKADAGKHAKLCGLLAKAINRRYGMNVVDENADPHEICQKVAELMYSLFTGLHTEFLNIAGDVSRIIKNLEVLQGIVDAANRKLMADLDNVGTGSDAQNTKILYEKVSEEIRRQHVMLSNLVNSSIGPVGSSLISILEENKDFTGLTEDLKKTTGTQYFGDKISLLLSGISDVSHSANLVNKALKTIGMSVADYKKVQGLKELRERVYGHIVDKKPNSAEMHKLLVAADILYRNDLAHDDIAEYLSKKTGGTVSMEPEDESFATMVDEVTWRDSTSTPFTGRSQSYRKSIGKQLREQQKYRNMLFGDFNIKIRGE